MSRGVVGGPSVWTRSVIDAKGTYPKSGWVITPYAQTQQVLETSQVKPPRAPMSLT